MRQLEDLSHLGHLVRLHFKLVATYQSFASFRQVFKSLFNEQSTVSKSKLW
jgi:hypothetical protein